MAKGRKRKAGPRTRSGQLSRAGKPGVKDVALNHPHRLLVPKEKRGAQEAECVVGRAFLRGLLSVEEYWAATKYRQLVDGFHQIMAAPITRQSAAAIGVAAGMEQPAEADYVAAEPEDEVERRGRITEAMNAASDALRGSGMLCVREVNAVVLEDKAIDNLFRLRAALDTLVTLWRLDSHSAPKRRTYWRGDRPTDTELKLAAE